MARIEPKMAWIFETPNPFEPHQVERYQVIAGTRIRDWVISHNPETGEFPVPTICVINGKPILRKDWNREIGERDIVNFIGVPGDPITMFVILVVVAIAIYLLLPIPTIPGQGPESDPVYSVKGQTNQIRLGEPIEVCYGRNRIYPSLASRPFYQYDGNDQFQYSLFCLGQGVYDIHAVQIGDSLISSFEEVESEVIEPGGVITMFPTNVFTSIEAGGQTLFAPNEEDDYVAPGFVGPFSANPVGTVTSKIQIDLVFPKGIYAMTKKGQPAAQSISVEAQKRLIDDSGSPLGAWTSLTNIVEVGATVTPQRKTYSIDVDQGRYEVQIRRISDKYISHNAGHEVVWEGMRSFIDGQEIEYGSVTLLAVKIRASNNLNDRTQQRFNVIATRKLPIRESGGEFSEPQATRSIVWAFVDVFRSTYGGRITDDIFFDWDALEELDALYTSRNEYFDWCFRDPVTVWEAAKTIARVGRAVPLLTGSLITMKRDGPLTVPVAMFNQENIVEGSFSWDIKLWDLDEHDSLSVEYTDPNTGYKQEQVTAVLPGESSNNPKDIRLIGIQDRTHAYREGMYILASERYLRENISFETGLEGFIPTYGDLIAVASDIPEWGQSGYVVNAQRGVGTAVHLFLSEPLVFQADTEHQILLRGRSGNVIGPLSAYETADPQQVTIMTELELDYLLDGQTEPMLFVFGISNEITRYVKVVRIEPQGGERIRVVAVPEVSTIHSFDSLLPAALFQPAYSPFPPDLPEIDNLYITQVDGSLHIIQIAWTAAFGAQSYIVETSEDGTHWQERASTVRTSVQLQVLLGPLWVRVAAINNGQGPWIEDQITVGILTGLDTNIPWDALEWEISWWEVLNAVGYLIKVYNSMGALILERQVTQAADVRSFNYDYTDATADANLVREMTVEVDALFEEETGTEPSGFPVQLELTNTVPLPPTSPASVIDSFDASEVVYELSWAVPALDDLIRVKVWISDTSGFDPEVDVPVYDFTAGAPGFAGIPTDTLVPVELDSFGAHSARYWRVALFDVWGNEISTNITAEQDIASYP